MKKPLGGYTVNKPLLLLLHSLSLNFLRSCALLNKSSSQIVVRLPSKATLFKNFRLRWSPSLNRTLVQKLVEEMPLSLMFLNWSWRRWYWTQSMLLMWCNSWSNMAWSLQMNGCGRSSCDFTCKRVCSLIYREYTDGKFSTTVSLPKTEQISSNKEIWEPICH